MRLLFLVPILCLLFLLACERQEPPAGQPSSEKPIVFVSIPPQARLVEFLSAGHVEVRTLVSAGQSPHTLELTPRQLDELTRASLYVRIGLPFEERILQKLESLSPDLKIIDQRDGVELIPITDHHHHHHGEEEEKEDSASMDPHIWLDPVRLRKQAENVSEALEAEIPKYRNDVEIAVVEFMLELDSVHAELSELLALYRGRKMYVYHPAYGYFADRYGLEQVAIEEEGKTPGARHTDETIAAIQRENVRTLFVQPQFSTRQAEAIAEATGVKLVVLDPLERDLLENLRSMGEKIAAGLGEAE